MKRHVQNAGIRRWSGDDLIELQSEPFKVLDKFFGQFGPMAVSGCVVSGSNISEGLVLLPDDTGTARVAPFKGATGISVFPVFLTLKKDTVSREYENATVQPVAYSYEAVLTQIKPVSGYFITISNTAKSNTFIDAIQDTMHRFATDKQITDWSQPRDFITDIVVDDLNTLSHKEGFSYFSTEGVSIGAPDTGTYHGITMTSGYQGIQLVFGLEKKTMYMRSLVDGQWTRWVKIWTEKSLPITKDNTVQAVKPWLPCRPGNGDAYMLDCNSTVFMLSKNSLPVEVYKYRVRPRLNVNFKGDKELRLLNSSGNEISLLERLNDTFAATKINQIAINQGETLHTGYIPISGLNNLILIKGANLIQSQITIETFNGVNDKVNTILMPYKSKSKTRAICDVAFTDQIKNIRIRVTGSDLLFSGLHVFSCVATLPCSPDLIYKFDGQAWQAMRVNDNVVNVRWQNFEMWRGDTTNHFVKTPTKKVQRLVFRGTTPEGFIKIQGVDSKNYICRFFIRKKVRSRLWDKDLKKGTAFARNIRYVEKLKKLTGGVNVADVLSRKKLKDDSTLPYTITDIYNSIFKKHTKRSTTTGLTRVSKKSTMPHMDSYADIAMCLSIRVDGRLIDGPMSYFRVTSKKLRER